ncbi:MAG: acyl-CoA thioesterase [Sandaracinus sp.]|nr:acyl-CoA thioesterase [Sandaracinus sp.]MCB9618798.1 acyl-CoA thioesterase [Sandaracinus sp.]MCB9637151.1 acyl-CoA thioesterase [Sandaracinus sp.]
MTFRTSIRVRFGDEDHARIAYFPRIVHFFHCAFEDFFDHQGHPYRKVLDEDGYGWPAVHLDVDFQSPLRFGDDFDVEVRVTKLGTKSATFRYEGSVGGRPAASATITVACIDMKTFRGVPIPDVYRELFGRHLDLPADAGPEGGPAPDAD